MECDVAVLGAGGAGLTAAISAHDFGAGDVVVLERSGMVGGTTAMSGGMLWVPNNHHQIEAGIPDSEEEIVAYLDSLAPGMLDPETLAAFMESGPEMIRYFADKTPVRFHTYPGFPDYQPYAPGAKAHGGRSLDNDAFPFEQLGSLATRVNPTKMEYEVRGSFVEAVNRALDAETLAYRRKHDYRGLGQALIGALYKAILDRGIPIQFERRARRLVKDGRCVIGVVAEGSDGEFCLRTRKGVVIATGGFEWNRELVDTFLRGPLTGPVSVPENEGDGLLMAIEAGAKLGNMQNAWWMQSVLEKKVEHRSAKPNYLLGSDERGRPGAILVNRAGRRFVNEAANYNAIGMALHAFDAGTHTYANLPYWLIIDQRYRDRYRIFNARRGKPDPSYVMKGNSLEELAVVAGIDPKGLEATVERFNGMVRKGHDDDFNRGDNTYDNWCFWGDQSLKPPHCTLGVLDQAPFYAVRMEAGALGTGGGPKTNGNAQVLDWNNEPIPGLYAAGNAMAAVLANAYGGAGGTLGPGMTFGFIAGRHAATASD
jgi:3-oxosteroid 1-dehydrogenase